MPASATTLKPITITHIIVGLGMGGAEVSLQRLVQNTSGPILHKVICFGQPTPIGCELEDMGVEVHWLDFRRNPFAALWRGWRIAQMASDVLQGWMYYGNVLASVYARRLPFGEKCKAKVAWNIRHSGGDWRDEKLRIRAALQCARLPILKPDLIIYNSHAGKQNHKPFGFHSNYVQVITNGVDTERFKPELALRERIRQCHKLVGRNCIAMICRFHHVKGVDVFLAAVSQLQSALAHPKQTHKASDKPLSILLAGPGMTPENKPLIEMIEASGVVVDSIKLLGPVVDVTQLLPGLDVVVLASRHEGTPNTLLEAMASGVACIATDVGDVGRILQDSARVVPADDVEAMVEAISSVLPHTKECGAADRAKIEADFRIDSCMAAYMDTYHKLLSEPTQLPL